MPAVRNPTENATALAHIMIGVEGPKERDATTLKKIPYASEPIPLRAIPLDLPRTARTPAARKTEMKIAADHTGWVPTDDEVAAEAREVLDASHAPVRATATAIQIHPAMRTATGGR